MNSNFVYIMIILVVFLAVFFIYHYIIQYDLILWLTKVDIGLTTGRKPSIPVFELVIFSLLFTLLVMDKLLKSSSNNSFIVYGKLILLSISAVLAQFIHLYFNHSGRLSKIGFGSYENTTIPNFLFYSLFIPMLVSFIGVLFGVAIYVWINKE